MKILLFNDNPVVRKLVALSAQKTKDDLSVVWSADEIEDREYDLLIVDDALYSDEMFEALNEKIIVKSTLFMATRGKAVPSGFDNVINKPFLPTDLVDMFVQIEKKVGSGSDQSGEASAATASAYSINLEDSLPEMEGHEGEDFDFENLDDYEDKLPETAILDQEEVQEVQGLLEDTEEDELNLEEEFTIPEMDTPSMPEEDIGSPIELEDDFSLEDTTSGIDDEETDDGLGELELAALTDESTELSDEDELLGLGGETEDDRLESDEEIPKNELLDEDEFGDLELPSSAEETLESSAENELLSMDDLEGFDDLGLTQEDELSAVSEEDSFDAEGLDELDTSMLMDDDELDTLESKIEDAVSGLESEDLERELETADFDIDLNDEIMEELMPSGQESRDIEMDDTGSFDELDMLDERELKIAVGEEVAEEDEPAVFVKDGSSLAAEALDEVLNESSPYADFTDEIEEAEPVASHAEGVEALQALLKALSNENVSKSLKGMNISININFGNGA
jgi:uncharacterized membrane protein